MPKRLANIRRRGNSWVVHFRRDGRQVWRSFQTQEEAELFLAQAQVRRAQAQPEPATRSPKLAAYATEWLDHMQARVGEQTHVNYESVLRVHILPTLGHLELRQLSRKTLDSFVSDWATEGPLFQERVRAAQERELARAREQDRKPRPIRVGHSPKTISNAVVVLCAMLGQAVAWSLLAVNPAAGLRRPRDDREHGEQMNPLDATGVRALIDAAEGQTARTLLLTAAMTGMRRGEILGVRWSDVDWNASRIHVRRSIGLNGAVKRPKSRKSVRAIALTATLTAELRRQRMASPFKDADDYVFPSDRGTPLDGRNMVRVVFEPALKRAKLPQSRFHDLRHTFASLLIQQKAHPKYVSEQLGHASVQITLDRYGHRFDQSYGDESAKLEAAFSATLPASTVQAVAVQQTATGFRDTTAGSGVNPHRTGV